MRSPSIKKLRSTGSFILDAAARAGWQDACKAFQEKLRKERSQMREFAKHGNPKGCYCAVYCKVEECVQAYTIGL